MTAWTVGDGDGDGERWTYLGDILRVPGKTGINGALDVSMLVRKRVIKAFSFSNWLLPYSGVRSPGEDMASWW